jgi:hypothetical protein
MSRSGMPDMAGNPYTPLFPGDGAAAYLNRKPETGNRKPETGKILGAY